VSKIEAGKEVTLRGVKYLVKSVEEVDGKVIAVHIIGEPSWYSPAGFLNELNKEVKKAVKKKK